MPFLSKKVNVTGRKKKRSLSGLICREKLSPAWQLLVFISLYVLKRCSFVIAVGVTITYFEPQHQASRAAQVPVPL